MTVHVVGNVCIDWRFRVRALPRPGETVNASELTSDLGGKGALQAIAARRTGAATLLHAAIGADADGELARALLREAGLSDAELVTVDAPTDRSVILVDEQGENAIVSAVAAARAFSPRGRWSARAEPGDLVLLQNNLLPGTTAEVLREAAQRGVRTVWNVSPLGDRLADLAMASVVVVNRGEGEALTEARTPSEMLAAFTARGARDVVVTLGREGAAILAEGEAHALAAPAVAAVDTSGAGDVFCGVLCGLLDRGLGLLPAADVAGAAAALAVTRPGTAGAIPSRAEVEALARVGGHP